MDATEFRIIKIDETDSIDEKGNLFFVKSSKQEQPKANQQDHLVTSMVCFLIMVMMIASGVLYFNHKTNTSNTNYHLITLTSNTYVYPSADEAKTKQPTTIIYAPGEYLVDQVYDNCIHIINDEVGGAWILEP